MPPDVAREPAPEAARLDLRPRLDPVELAVSRWPLGWSPGEPGSGFSALVSDDDEVTWVCAAPLLAGQAGEAPLAAEHGWRRVTFAGPLPWEQVGFLADVAGRLAGAQIPFTSIAGFTTDHVLVRAAQAELAVAVLSGQPPPPARPGTTNP